LIWVKERGWKIKDSRPSEIVSNSSMDDETFQTWRKLSPLLGRSIEAFDE
jgi:hypothetical protein